MISYEESLQVASKNSFQARRDELRANNRPGTAQEIYESGFNGCFGPEVEPWMTSIYDHDKGRVPLKDNPNLPLPQWRGSRAVYWHHYMAAIPSALTGQQNVGNCTSWSGRAMLNCLLAADIGKRREDHKMPPTRIGTATMYANRGHQGDGMTLGAAIEAAATKYGCNTEAIYCGGRYDLSTEDKDEGYGVAWWRGVPDCVVEETSKHKLLQYDQAATEDKCLAYLADGRFLFHGSTMTAQPSGELISSLQSIGGHAQAVLGYDDSDEFKRWYRESTGRTLNDYVVIHDQSWGDWNPIRAEKWPAHLWGPKFQGAWVVTGRDFMRMVHQWQECYAAIDMGGFPNGGPVAEWLATVTWTPSPSSDVEQQVLEWVVNDQARGGHIMSDPRQRKSTSEDAGIANLKSGDRVDLKLFAVSSSGQSSPAAEWSGVVQSGDGPDPPTQLACEFTRR
jgi:hypothetical protein